MKTHSLKPPIPFSLTSIISIFQRLDSAYLEYIRKSSAAKRAASSPPAPALISTITFFSSIGSLGIRRTFSSCSIFAMLDFASESSSLSISFISSSSSTSSISRLSSMVCFVFLYSVYFSTRGCRSLCSFISLRKCF